MTDAITEILAAAFCAALVGSICLHAPPIGVIVLGAWLGIGVDRMIHSDSEGWLIDGLFVMAWPVRSIIGWITDDSGGI